MPQPRPEDAEHASASARKIAGDAGVRFSGVDELLQITARQEHENVYLIDVRSREEYAAGHIPGFRWVPGGQAVQATDSFVGVRGGQIVFACDGIVRASMTAAWFRDMGWIGRI